MAIPKPLILTDAGLKIGKGPLPTDLTELACSANHIELTPDTAVTTLDTMCGSADYPGTTKWSLIATLYQSFDPLATEEVLSAAVSGSVPVPFELVGYKSQAVGPTNPKWSGTVMPEPYSPINGDAGAASTVELEWAVVTGPVKSITPVAGLAAGDLEAKTVDELRTLAGEAGLPTTGTKVELLERLAPVPA